ncbi:MAG TPA: hypothetical protein VMU57_21720 [Edaphobacter sp.]|uniref:hypothetical protein n=1 Tax=Edaphobacter sp. TaxID=1934404 RepID=UPI002D015CA6|nr:hypothetical protein [Edaphobacter sp.]HUZ97532.1 hypothetical protein [Edaphobacter sp.]
MKLRHLAVLFFIALSSAAARAQVAIYGTFDATHLSDNSNHQATWFYGPSIGAYYDFVHLGPLAAGVDLRGNFLFGSHEKYRSGLVGLRLSAKPPILPIKPYAQFSIGAGGAKADGTANFPDTNYSTKFQYEVLGGVDLTVLPRIDLRVAEVGYGRMSGVNGGTNAPASSLVTVGAGLVFRLP